VADSLGAGRICCTEKRLGCTETRRTRSRGCDSQTGAKGEGLHQSTLPLQTVRSTETEAAAKNRTKSKIRSRVEHAFWIIKGLFGFTKVRYRGLAKNLHRMQVTCALANLFMVRRRLLRDNSNTSDNRVDDMGLSTDRNPTKSPDLVKAECPRSKTECWIFASSVLQTVPR